MMRLEHALDRRLTIAAEPATVFRFFTDSERWAAWWGKGSRIDPKVGGAVSIVYPGDVRVRGEVLELVPNEKLVFTYGYEAPDKPIKPGGSRVTISLARAIGGTLLELKHEFADAPTRDMHIQGWRYQLAVFANLVTKEQHQHAEKITDDWFVACNEPDQQKRAAALERITAPDVAFRDQYGHADGLAELTTHIAALHYYMPGMLIAREGDLKRANATAVVAWVAKKPSGEIAAKGTNVFDFAPDGRVQRVIGIWG